MCRRVPTLNDIRVTELKLGPEGITTMTPAPEELTSFETYRTVDIRYHDFEERWILYVVPTDIKVELTGADAWTRLVWLYAQGRPGTALGFRYRVQGAGEWSEVPAEKVETEGGTFRACLSGLEPLTTYEVVAYSDEELSAVETVTTGAEVPLVNGGFEEVVYGGRYRLSRSLERGHLLGYGQYGCGDSRCDADGQDFRCASRFRRAVCRETRIETGRHRRCRPSRGR